MAIKPEAFFDFDPTKLLSDFKVPGVDVESVLASQKRNIEALTAANRTAVEGLQAVAKRQMEILRAVMEQAAAATKDIAEAATPQEKAAKQAELAKVAFESALSNLRELSEMVAKSNAEALDLLNKRFTANLDEVRDALLKAKK